MRTLTRTTQQRRADLRAEVTKHFDWLSSNGLPRIVRSMHEATFTGVLCSALLNETSQDLIVKALGLQGTVVDVLAVAQPVDLVVRLQQPSGRTTAAAIEVKGYETPSHAPGYTTDDYALWQTDRMHALATGYKTCSCGYTEACSRHGCPVCKGIVKKAPKLRGRPQWWTGELAGQVDEFVLLDFEGRDIDEAFDPPGLCSSGWSAVSYTSLGRALREEYERLLHPHVQDAAVSRVKASALVPLLVTLFADRRF